ncbi:MAG: pilus assembly protein CpaF [Actinomycetota bacterium]|nr:pilus assembly protein CpaF [Actinomycetota bacterium]
MTAERGRESRLVDDVRRGLARSAADGDPAAVAALVRRHTPVAGTTALLDATRRVAAEVTGAGVLEPLLRLPGVTDVLVNGPGPVWLDRGAGLERSDVVIAEETELRRLAQRLVASCGRRLDDAVPYADARLPDGTRVHAVLPPLSPQGTCLSLRLPPRRTFSLGDLVAAGSLPVAGVPLLEQLVEARVAFVVTGGTGTGKTTVLSTLLSLVPPAERLVLVEDAVELRPAHPHVVRLESRLPNAEGAGGVDLAVLVRQALRMRPDRLVVGEVRGAEVRDLLTALNTGHAGGCGTVHANRAEHVPARFEALGAACGLSRTAVHSQLAASLDAVVHLTRDRQGRRRVAGVAVLSVDDGGLVRALPAVTFTECRAGTEGIRGGPGEARLSQLLAAGG